jgi:hypothetical protein
MSTRPNKLSVEKHVTKPDAKHYVRVVYTKAITWNLTMSGSTGVVHWRMCELVSLLVTKIGYGSLNGHK